MNGVIAKSINVIGESDVVADSYDNGVKGKILTALVEKGLMVRRAIVPIPFEYEVVVPIVGPGGKTNDLYRIGIPMTEDELLDMDEIGVSFGEPTVVIVAFGIVFNTCDTIIKEALNVPAKKPMRELKGKTYSYSMGVDCFNTCPYGYACDVCPRYIPAQNTY